MDTNTARAVFFIVKDLALPIGQIPIAATNEIRRISLAFLATKAAGEQRNDGALTHFCGGIEKNDNFTHTIT